MAFGEIYNFSWWGEVCSATNGWGSDYYDEAGCSVVVTTFVLAENGDFIITETGDNVIQG